MPTLSRSSLASLICPSAPFLAPRLLRTRVPPTALQASWLLPTPGRRYKSDGKTPRKIRARPPKQTQQAQQAQRQQSAGQQGTTLDFLRHACTNLNLSALRELYPGIVLTGALNRDDTRRITQALHTLVRNREANIQVDEVRPFVEQLVQDLQAGTLPLHPYAFVHLLGIFKTWKMYDEGYALWQWLVHQNDAYVSPAAYGAVIELLTFGDLMKLPELEALYVDALKRFPGTFAEYHLSPDAIVPNRRQPTIIPGLPMTLLQGILTARLRNGAWKKSYLALDTALRLYPHQLPPRFFVLFMTSRPLGEAYTVFLVACRAGIILPPQNVTALITRIKQAMEETDTLRDRMTLLRAIANAIYAYQEAGASLQPIHVGQFLTSFGSLLPGLALGTDYEGDMATLRNRIVTFAHGTLSTLLQAGMPPSPQAFIAIVHLAGTLRVPDLLRVSLQDIATAKVDIGDIGIRTALFSAGQTGAQDLIEEQWAQIVNKANTQGNQISYRHWVTLSKACKGADHTDFFRTQLSQLEHAIPASRKDHIMAIPDNEIPHEEKKIELLPPPAFQVELEKLDKQINNIAAVVMSGQPLDIHKTPFYMSLDPERPPLARHDDLQKVYDEYTLDPHQPPLEDATVPVPVSSTRIPLDQLRFQNWVSVVELMERAEMHQQRKQALKKRTDAGEDVQPSLADDLLLNDRHPPSNLTNLRLFVKRLRDPSSDEAPKLRKLAWGSEGDYFPKIRQRGVNQLRIIHHQYPETKTEFRSMKLNLPPAEKAGPDAAAQAEGGSVPDLPPRKLSKKPLVKRNELNILYYMYPLGTQVVPAPAGDASSPTKPPPKLSRRPLEKLPTVSYYASLRSHHEAPVRPKLSRRPLGRAKSPRHHEFRVQPPPEENHTDESKA